MLQTQIQKMVYCKEHHKYEKVVLIDMGFVRNVPARKCVSYWRDMSGNPVEDYTEFIPLEALK